MFYIANYKFRNFQENCLNLVDYYYEIHHVVYRRDSFSFSDVMKLILNWNDDEMVQMIDK